MLSHANDLGGRMGDNIAVLCGKGNDHVLGPGEYDGERRILRHGLVNALEHDAGRIIATHRVYNDLDLIHAHPPASRELSSQNKEIILQAGDRLQDYT